MERCFYLPWPFWPWGDRSLPRDWEVRAFQETNMSVGLDVAAGVDDWGIYFQIGEAF